MKLNEEKLTSMVEVVLKEMFPAIWVKNPRPEVIRTEAYLRTALTPFCMEMTDEEIFKEVDKRSDFMEDWIPYEDGFIDGAKFIRDGNK